MKITVSLNNHTMQVVPESTLATLLGSCGYDAETASFAVAVNSTFVPREQYDTRVLEDQDLIDIVRPVSGG